MDYWNYDINAYSSDDEPRRPKVIRNRPHFFEEFDEKDFFDRFRLSKRSVQNVLDEIRNNIEYPTNRNDCLSPENQLLLFLSFISNGSFLKISGDFCGVSRPTACKTIKRVSRAIASLRPQYIKMPQTLEEISYIRQKVFEIARFPGCIGAIDCTHIRVQSPGGDNAEIFRNRKNFFSINVQTISNYNLEIEDIVARWPGSSHDSHIFRSSNIYRLFENRMFGNSLIVGDSGYPIKNYLITPLNEIHNEAERLFNESQIRTRNVVERQYGVWKRRFPALAMGLRLRIQNTQTVIVASAVLHNIACKEREDVPPVNQEQEAAIQLVNNIPLIQGVAANHIEEGGIRLFDINNTTRLHLINNYYVTLV